MPKLEEVILVDARNSRIGTGEKLSVHRQGLLHRAFSIFLVDWRGAVLLQRRHPAKYHSGGLWANTCCGHPRPGEPTIKGARRRLFEELGVRAALTRAFQTEYYARFDNGLSENEIVSIYVGPLAGELQPQPEEVVELTTMTLAELSEAVQREPGAYAYWLHHYLSQHRYALEQSIAAVQQLITRDAKRKLPVQPQAIRAAPASR